MFQAVFNFSKHWITENGHLGIGAGKEGSHSARRAAYRCRRPLRREHAGKPVPRRITTLRTLLIFFPPRNEQLGLNNAQATVQTRLTVPQKANMRSAAAIRVQVESALAKRVPSALTPPQRLVRPVLPTGISTVDDLIGGLPMGAITEMTGPESSGRTSLAMSFLRGVTRRGNVCAWIDVSDGLHGESAAAAGVDLARLLWVRCGIRASNEPDGYSFKLPGKYLVPQAAKRGLHGGGFGPHPRTETKRVSEAMGELFPHERAEASPMRSPSGEQPMAVSPPLTKARTMGKPWTRIEQALKATDLLLQAGGFSAVVLDLAGIAPEFVLRIELSVWFRYRAAVERSQACLLLLTKHPTAKSAGELLLRLHPKGARTDEATIFTGIEHRLEVERRRFVDNVVALRKPPQSTHTAWKTQPAWVLR